MDSNTNVSSQIFTDAPVVYATFWERFGASFIDGLILLIPNLLIIYYASFATIFTLGPFISLNYFTVALMWAYFALQESSPSQATLGKKAMGIKVVDSDGRRLSFGKATIRNLGKYISQAIILIGYFMMLWDDKNQTLHDKMAGTYVIKKDPNA